MLTRTWLIDGCRRVARGLGSLARERRANVMMLVALAAPLVVGTAGFAVDFGYSAYLKRSLDQAADAASLAATSQSAAASGGGYSNTSWLRQFGINTFTGNVAKLHVAVTPTVTVVSNGTGGVIATASYTYSMPTYFSTLLGIPAIPIAGSATATANPITYIDYYILLDISQSMGIGSTAADMQNLFNRTKAYNGTNNGCVFGCHVARSGDSYANENLAHNYSPKITLRIDSAISAIQTIIADAQSAAGSTKNIRIGVYTMSDDPTNNVRFTQISAPTSNYSTLSNAVAGIGLGSNVSSGQGDTSFDYAISQLSAKMPATNGTGLLQANPKNYVFIITDGTRDKNTPGQCYYGHCMSAFDPSLCTPLKSQATLGTIYTTYLPIYNNNDSAQGYQVDYVNTAQPYVSQLPGNMQACATDSTLYYRADDGPAIDASMKALFASTLKTSRLTQ